MGRWQMTGCEYKRTSRIGLVAIDVDDTLVGDELVVPPACREAIKEAIDRGVVVTLATGRMFQSALPYARQLGITAPLITYNGALVKTPDGEVIRHRPIPKEVAQQVATYQDEGTTLNVYWQDELYVARVDEQVLYYVQVAGVEPHPVGDLGTWLSRIECDGPTKMLFVGEPAFMEEKRRILRQDFGDVLEITRSKPKFIELTQRNVSKGAALADLARSLGIPRSMVMAIGDSFNDLDMISYAGVGVAVGNASEEVRRAADYVTCRAEEAGVADALHRFVILQ